MDSLTEPGVDGWVVGRCACGALQVLEPKEELVNERGRGEGGPYVDGPFDEVAAEVEEHVRRGSTFFQKFTCAGCGQRLTMDVPNKLYTSGGCDKCGHVTDIQAQGCNYLLMMGISLPESI
jgi:hypothetical protein